MWLLGLVVGGWRALGTFLGVVSRWLDLFSSSFLGAKVGGCDAWVEGWERSERGKTDIREDDIMGVLGISFTLDT